MIEIDIWENKLEEAEAHAAYQAVMDRCVSDGRIVKAMEEKIGELREVPYVIATPNGTSALLLALMAAGVGPGDEVIVPDITFIATANAAKILGATVVVADTMEHVPVISEESVMRLLTEKTKVVLPVHINGHIACTKQLRENMHQREILVIDDACQAFLSGRKGDYAGSHADIACYSMGISKTAASGQGGFVTTSNEKLYRLMKKLKTQGLDSLFVRENYTVAGFNFKMSDILAAIGLVQLEKIDKKINHLWEVYHQYQEGLKGAEGISFIPRKEYELPWMTYILCENRDAAKLYLEKRGVVARDIGECLHRAAYLEARDEYAHSEKFERQILALPSGPDQPLEHVQKVCQYLREGSQNLWNA